jgi:hypothetical protein
LFQKKRKKKTEKKLSDRNKRGNPLGESCLDPDVHGAAPGPGYIFVIATLLLVGML